MKKTITTLIAVLAFCASAQSQKVTGVCGADYGDKFEIAKEKIQTWFETEHSKQDPLGIFHSLIPSPSPMILGTTINYLMCKYEGVQFDNISFSFTETDDGHLFSDATFQIHCKNKKQAKLKLEEVVEAFQAKYTIAEGTYDNGKRLYGGGDSMLDPDKCAFIIFNEKEYVYVMFRYNGF